MLKAQDNDETAPISNMDEINNVKNQINDLRNDNQSIYRNIESSYPEYNDISGNKIIRIDFLNFVIF